jgi:hypothetical protein
VSNSFEALFARAFARFPAREANERIAEVRDQVAAQYGASANYEIVLDGRDGRYLLETVAPRLAFFLRSKRYAVANCGPVFLSIFLGDRLYFLHCDDFWQFVRVVAGYTEEAFAGLAKHWEQTGRAALAALPTAEPPDA